VDRPTGIPLKIGDWHVDPTVGQISRKGESVRLEARTIRLLLCLAGRPGEVVSVDRLLDEVWSGVVVTPDSVYQAVTSLRRLFRDDAKQPNYIETVPRLGYRLVAPVGPWVDEAAALSATAFAGRDPDAARRMRVGLKTGLFAFGCAVLLLLASLPWNQQKTPARPDSATVPRSVGVLPFLDLTTQDMKEEYFADGITEELINKLSRVPGLKVPAPTASFYYKNKKVPIATIGRSLGVSYLLDGSIRESGSTMRVSARLVRSEDGYVLWSETYDRPANDRLRIQGDIATAVSKALSTAIN
jgi:TolB-like protein/DNA-binding winged helix-turn-helix (wHTH) protein